VKLPWKRTHSTRGAGILTVLVASTLLLLLAFTVAGTSFHHLSVSNRLNHGQKAKNLAEAALARAIAELMHEHTKYQGASPPPFPLPVFDDPDRQKVFLTFDSGNVAGANAQLKKARLRTSFNNFGNDASVVHEGRTIPGETAYLCAVGVDHGVERTAECVIYIPKFPWSLASAGPIKAEGKTRVSSVKNLADIGDPEKELPGHLVTNSTDATEAVLFDGTEVVVTGDVQASGGATFGDNVIMGERRLRASPAPIPTLKIEDYRTDSLPGVTTFIDSNGPNEVTGYAYRDGGLNFSSGLKLNGGVVYVNGDITINGQIEGEGAIISTGKIDIRANGALASSNKVAILAKSDLELRGTSTDHLLVQGQIYTEGKLYSENVDIIGNTVSAQDPIGPPGMNGMTLKDTNVYSNEQYSSLEIAVGGSNAPTSFEIGGSALGDGPSLEFTTTDFDLSAYGIGVVPDVGVGFHIADSAPLWDTTSQKYVFRYQTSNARDQLGNVLPPGIYRGGHDGTNAYDIPSPSGPPLIGNESVRWKVGTELLDPNVPADFDRVLDHFVSNINAQRLANSQPVLDAGQLAVLRAVLEAYSKMETSPTLGRIAATNSSAMYSKSWLAPGTPPPPPWVLDFNRREGDGADFIARAEQIRLLYWRDMP